MSINTIIVFITGVFVGQELTTIPRVRPYIEAGVRKAIDMSKEIYENANEHGKHTNTLNSPTVTEIVDGKENAQKEQNERRSFWRN